MELPIKDIKITCLLKKIFVEVHGAAKEPDHYFLFKLTDQINQTMSELIAPHSLQCTLIWSSLTKTFVLPQTDGPTVTVLLNANGCLKQRKKY